tara:strand:- start:44 stop:394 length:351 start_codon:yes stop_codon:yes gene_type:complete
MHFLFKGRNFLIISLGAIPAAIFRWQIDEIIIVNIIGCFVLGFINALSISKQYKLMLGFGFCGSLTTFSGWMFNLFTLLNHSLYLQLFFKLFAMLSLGFCAVFFGDYVAKKLKKLV